MQTNMILRWVKRLMNQSRTPVIASATGGTVTADMAFAQGGAIVANVGATAAATFALPAAKKGMKVTAIVKAAYELRVDPYGEETLAAPATGAQAAAGKYIGADAVGESGVWVCVVDGTWDYVGPTDGTWTAQS